MVSVFTSLSIQRHLEVESVEKHCSTNESTTNSVINEIMKWKLNARLTLHPTSLCSHIHQAKKGNYNTFDKGT